MKLLTMQGDLDTKFDVLKMNAHSKNAVGCIPFLAMETKSRNQNIYEIADQALKLNNPNFTLSSSPTL